MRRILHPTDFSPASSAAFTQAVQLAKQRGAELVIAHVLTPTLPTVDRYVGQQIHDQIEAARRQSPGGGPCPLPCAHGSW